WQPWTSGSCELAQVASSQGQGKGSTGGRLRPRIFGAGRNLDRRRIADASFSPFRQLFQHQAHLFEFLAVAGPVLVTEGSLGAFEVLECLFGEDRRRGRTQRDCRA